MGILCLTPTPVYSTSHTMGRCPSMWCDRQLEGKSLLNCGRTKNNITPNKIVTPIEPVTRVERVERAMHRNKIHVKHCPQFMPAADCLTAVHARCLATMEGQMRFFFLTLPPLQECEVHG